MAVMQMAPELPRVARLFRLLVCSDFCMYSAQFGLRQGTEDGHLIYSGPAKSQ